MKSKNKALIFIITAIFSFRSLSFAEEASGIESTPSQAGTDLSVAPTWHVGLIPLLYGRLGASNGAFLNSQGYGVYAQKNQDFFSHRLGLDFYSSVLDTGNLSQRTQYRRLYIESTAALFPVLQTLQEGFVFYGGADLSLVSQSIKTQISSSASDVSQGIDQLAISPLLRVAYRQALFEQKQTIEIGLAVKAVFRLTGNTGTDYLGGLELGAVVPF